MKKTISVILAAILAFGALSLLSFGASAKTYYIDSIIGSDSAEGTSPDSAWKTVANLASVQLNAGDSVLFRRGGDYECAITLTCSGTKENPILISAYGDGSENLPHLFTNEKAEVLRLFDCSFVTVSNLEITAHNGGGIWIDTLSKTSDGIILNNLKMHDMQNMKWTGRDNLSAGAAVARACVMVKGLPCRSRYPVNNLTISNCEMYDTGNGISLWGSWNEAQSAWCEKEEDIDPVFNENTLVTDVYFHDMAAEAIIVGISKNALVTHCRAINCCQDEGTDENGNVVFYNAAMWFWGSVYSTIEYCEIAGQKNVGDGMAVDFDSYSHHCTYQYIYSHDNNIFMCNCPNYSGHHGNTVRYCLSVNDNKHRSRIGGDAGEHEFSFYNNTLVNCGDFHIINMYDSYFANNIFIPAEGCCITSDSKEIINPTSRNNTYKNNCYYNCLTPIVDKTAKNTLPGFCGDDYSNPESFILSADSKLIGAGCANENAVETDFFGNEITSNNIGCYSGEGVIGVNSKVRENFAEKLVRLVRNLFEFISYGIQKLSK